MTRSNVQLSNQEVQNAAQGLLGRFFIAFASMELNLSLHVGAEGKFQEKLERFYGMAIAPYGNSDEHLGEISAWYVSADSMRKLRNRFAHGRWGFLTEAQSVVHVSGYPPGPQDERHFSLAELETIVQEVELLGDQLNKLVR